MTEKDFMDALELHLLRRWARIIALDLYQCKTQTIRTSKHARRERCLSYLIESLTGNIIFTPAEQDAIDLINIIEEIKGNTEEPEAKIGLDRAEKRLRWRLSNQDFLEVRHCIACGETYKGDNHECTSKEAAAKDKAMTRDDLIQ